MRILYLYAELMGYQIPVFKELHDLSNADIHVVHWDKTKLTPYKAPSINKVTYYNKSEFNTNQLLLLVKKIHPNIVYISGWQDKDYLRAVFRLKSTGVPIIVGFDDQWKGTLKQKVASLLAPIILRRLFSHAWVAGPYQYYYARKMGFDDRNIIFNCLCADLDLFNVAYRNTIESKRRNYPHRFLYVGRYDKVKGLDLLIEAWQILNKNYPNWELCLIGNGSLKNVLSKHPNIIVKDFLQPNELVEEIKNAGCFLLPSRKEPWALVLHEFAAAGLPIICSDICGAAPVFVTPGYNGYTFHNEDVEGLMNRMESIMQKSDEELIIMAERSHMQGQKITPEITAASFLSVLS